jgi:signal transduction histidine kinase
VREDERKKIARELHDELGQMLTAVKLDANWLLGKVSGELPEVQCKADAMSKLIDKTLDAMRRISADLRPVMLDDLGLAAAVEWLTEDFSERTGIGVKLVMDNAKCKFQCNDEASLPCEDSLSQEVATAAYRIVQECLTNVVRHAEAEQVQVSLNCQDGRLRVRVSDDGKGISVAHGHKQDSYGVIGMRERAHGLGGSFNVSSHPGKGTAVEVIIPIRDAALAGALQ